MRNKEAVIRNLDKLENNFTTIQQLIQKNQFGSALEKVDACKLLLSNVSSMVRNEIDPTMEKFNLH